MSRRILALADAHVGSGVAYGTTIRGHGSRLDDQRDALRRVSDIAAKERVDLVVIAGDTYHRPKPTPAEILVVQEFLNSISAPVVMIAGNAGHDGASAGEPSPVEIHDTDAYIATTPRLHFVGGCSVACLPGVPPSHLAAQRNGGGRDDLHVEMAGMLVEVAAGLRARCLPDQPAILVAHWAVQGASLPTGIAAVDLREPVLSAEDLYAQGWDQIILGHLHRPQTLVGDDAFYCGSVVTTDFGDAGVEHGVWIIDTPTYTRTFHPIEQRPFITLDLDVYGTTDHDTCMVQTGDPDFTDAIVRVRYTATPEQARRVDEQAIRQNLLDAGAHKVVSITAEVTSGDRARIPTLTTDLADDDALRLWLDRRGVDEGLDERVCARHGRYGEEVRG